MNLRVYVGNLPYAVRDAELRSFFEEAGCKVADDIVDDEGKVIEKGAVVILDRRDERERSKGFGFVTLADQESFDKAIALKGTDMQGRPLDVSQAREREDRSTSAPEAAAPVAAEAEAPAADAE